MNRNSDIGENTAIVITVGLVVGMPLLLAGWLLNRVREMSQQPAQPTPKPTSPQVTVALTHNHVLVLPPKI